MFLKNYLDSISSRFRDMKEGNEIISDIESRIAEIFQTRVNDKKEVITLEDVNDVISIMGKPEDFYDTEELEKDQVILKTLKWQRNYTAQIYEHNHIDVLASERLTALPNMIDIYGYCDQATLNELATGKDLVHVMTYNWTSTDLLQFATEAAWGIADTHSIDFPNGDNATLMHNNLDPANFLVAQDGRIKLSDFNLGKLLRWSTPLNARCAKGIFVEQLEW